MEGLRQTKSRESRIESPHVQIQKIIESLLRSRLYRTGVLIQTDDGDTHDVLVSDVQYEGSRSFALVHAAGRPDHPFSIPLSRIRRVGGGGDAGPPPKRRTGTGKGTAA